MKPEDIEKYKFTTRLASFSKSDPNPIIELEGSVLSIQNKKKESQLIDLYSSVADMTEQMKEDDQKLSNYNKEIKKLSDELKKNSTEKIKILNALNTLIVDNAPISIMIINKEGVVTFTNKYYKILTENEKSPVGRSMYTIPFFTKENLCESYKKLLAHGTIFKKENCASTNAKGEPKYISITAVPLKNPKGEIESALSMALDVTDAVLAKKELEQMNEKLEDKVRERTHQLAKTNEALNYSLAAKMQFISDASHELRTPLTIIKGYTYLAKKEFEEKNQSIPEIYDTIDHEVDKIATILKDLSFLTKRDGAHENIVIEDLDLNKLLASVAKELKIFADEKKISLSCQIRKHPLLIKGDPDKLERLFSNVVKNAIKYSSEKGWVKVELKPALTANKVNVIISDNGIGISRKDMPYIFERFYRTDAARRTGEGGFGLGLAICKWIIEQHAGSIKVQSREGKGSVFMITLPTNLEESNVLEIAL